MQTLNIYTKTIRPCDAVYIGSVIRETAEACITYAKLHHAANLWEFDGVNRAALANKVAI